MYTPDENQSLPAEEPEQLDTTATDDAPASVEPPKGILAGIPGVQMFLINGS